MKLSTKKNRKKPAADKTPIKRGRAAALRTKGEARMRRQSYVLNDKEKRVLDAFAGEPGDATTLSDLAKHAFNKRGVSPKTQGNSWVRNSLRKLVRLGLVLPAGGPKSGSYTRTKLTAQGVYDKAVRDGLVIPEGEEGDKPKPRKPRAKPAAKVDKAEKAEGTNGAEKAVKAGRKRSPRKAAGKKAAKADVEEGEPVTEVTMNISVEGQADDEADDEIDDNDGDGDADGDGEGDDAAVSEDENPADPLVAPEVVVDDDDDDEDTVDEDDEEDVVDDDDDAAKT